MNRREEMSTDNPEYQYMTGTQYHPGDSSLLAYQREHGCMDFSKPENNRRLTERGSDE